MNTNSQNIKFDYIDTDEQLIAFSRRIEQAAWMAVDTEFMRERTYYAQLALIQIATEDAFALIDVPALSSLAPLEDAFSRRGCLKIMHSASQDLEVLSQSMGVMPAPLFDTQIAASFLGEPDQIAYGAIVKQRLGIALDKDQTRTNWLQRPLSPAQLGYAELDVLYLYELYTQLLAELETVGRLEWVQAESQALADKTMSGVDIDNAWTRIKGLGRLTAQQQNIVRALAAWREERAQNRDLPREWVLKKQAIIGLARMQPTSPNQMHDIEGLHSKQVQNMGKMLIRLVQQAADQSVDTWPEPEQELNAGQRGQTKKIMAELRRIGEAQKIAPSLIANRNAVEQLVLGQRDLALLRGWRAEVAGNAALEMLQSLNAEG